MHPLGKFCIWESSCFKYGEGQQVARVPDFIFWMQVCHRVGIFDFADDDQAEPLLTAHPDKPVDDDNNTSDMFTEDHVSASYWSDSGRQGSECSPDVTRREPADGQESCNETSCASDDRTRHPNEETMGPYREMRVISVISQRDFLQLVHQNRSRYLKVLVNIKLNICLKLSPGLYYFWFNESSMFTGAQT